MDGAFYLIKSKAAIFFRFLLVAAIGLGLFWSLRHPGAKAANLSSGDLIKASLPAVYYYGGDGKRYVFPNEKSYKTWYADFSTVKTITDAELAAITIGGNATYRPGVKMVKITTDPKVYAVAKGGVLRWVASEAVAVALFGSDWNKKVEDIPDAFFTNYKLGANINSVYDYDKAAEITAAPTINADKALSGSVPSLAPEAAPAQVPVPYPAPSPEPTASTYGAARIFFTDLESGPNTGGEDNAGVFVTIWGKNFGAARGASFVIVGGGNVHAYKKWSDSQIIIQLGSQAKSGQIVVKTSSGSSNGVPFTVRSGNIYFVSVSGNDYSSGSFSAPWRTIVKAKNALAPGDIVYVMNGVSQTAEDNFSAALSLESSGTSIAPKAIAAYPGALATIGSTGFEFGIRVPNIGIAATDWVISKLTLRGGVQALDIGGSGSKRWRVVGNDISCPQGNGQTGCFAASLASNIAFLGNEAHGISQQGVQPSKQYHAVYFTTDTNHVEVGWNHIHDNLTCRAIQFHSSPLDEGTGYNQYDLSVHDNLIHGDVCDGINLATVDPSKGAIRVWNNIIYDVGRGPDPPDGAANYACINVPGYTNAGADGRGVIEVFNNTFSDCGGLRSPSAGAISRGEYSSGLIIDLKNNIVSAESGEKYISEESTTAYIRGSNNLFFGAGIAPGFLTANVSADPLFKNKAAGDFHLRSGSPATDVGVSNFVYTDFDGVGRPQGAAVDLGALEFVP